MTVDRDDGSGVFPAELLARVQTPVKHPDLVLRPTHRPGDWNSCGVDIPFVFSVDGRAGMTVVGWDGTGYQTGLSWLGEDGRWTEPVLVFGRDPSSRFRRYNAAITGMLRDPSLDGPGELIRVDGAFLATWHAYPAAGYEEGSAVIGFARSTDLLHWEEVGGVLSPLDGAPWERGGLYKSWLMRHDGRYLLFYNAKDRADGGWREQTGAAVSVDLVHWDRLEANPLLVNGGVGSGDERFASDPCVLRAGDRWLMFYFGLAADGCAREYVATSTDLVTWTKAREPLVDVGAPGAIDATYAHKPSVVTRNGVLEHYYCAVAPLPEQIELAGVTLREMRGIGLATSV